MKFLCRYLPWLLLLLAVDVFGILLLWLADVQAFFAMATVIILFTILSFAALCWVLIRLEQKRDRLFLEFLGNPDEYHEELLLKSVNPARKEPILCLGRTLREKQAAYTDLQEQWNDYEEYVESWAHEIKIPLSLLTLLLDNRREELPVTMAFKLDYVRNHMRESVDQMLFYARLNSMRKDYLLESIPVLPCIEELLEEYKPLLDEKEFRIQCSLSHDTVYSDRRGLRFLLGQLISNSIKYCGKEPKLCFRSFQRENNYILSIKDNGIGVRACDLPYIYEKGFTGDSGEENRKKATGMGLYLVKEMAKELNLSLQAFSRWGEGFEMQISFPVVKESPRTGSA